MPAVIRGDNAPHGPADEDLVVLLEHPGKLPGAHFARHLGGLASFFAARPGPVRLRVYWQIHKRMVREAAIGGRVSGKDLEVLEGFPQVRSAVVRPRSTAHDHYEPPLSAWPDRLGTREGDELNEDDEALALRNAAIAEAIARVDEALGIASLPRLRSQLDRDRSDLLEMATVLRRGVGQPSTPCEEWAHRLDRALDELCATAKLVTLRDLAGHRGCPADRGN